MRNTKAHMLFFWEGRFDMANIYRFLRFPEGKLKAVTFSYDDGVRADIRFAKILDDHGMKGTININSSRVKDGSNNALTFDELREHILGKGHEVALHGAFHRAPCLQRTVDGIRDVLDCRIRLESNLGTIIRGMAYPDSGIRQMGNFGSYEQIKQYLTELDIVYARTLGGDNDSFMLPRDFHAWMPSAHHDNPKIMEYIQKFLDLDISAMNHWTRLPRLLYIWGHSYEFDRKDNWDHMEEICEKLANNEDIWYATNIEIYDYTQAYKSLIYSADGHRIYNPTLFTVWLCIDGKICCVKYGETLRVSD